MLGARPDTLSHMNLNPEKEEVEDEKVSERPEELARFCVGDFSIPASLT
jgi:hypothetical protein